MIHFKELGGETKRGRIGFCSFFYLVFFFSSRIVHELQASNEAITLFSVSLMFPRSRVPNNMPLSDMSVHLFKIIYTL